MFGGNKGRFRRKENDLFYKRVHDGAHIFQNDRLNFIQDGLCLELGLSGRGEFLTVYYFIFSVAYFEANLETFL